MDADLATEIEHALGVGPTTAALLALRSSKQSFSGNSVVYYQDDPTSHICLLLRGHIRLSYISEDGVVTLLSIVTPGKTFGESGCLQGYEHCDTAFTVGPTEILMIDTSHLNPDNSYGAELREAMARIIAQRYRSHVEFTRALYLPNLGLRLSHALFFLLKELGNEIRYDGRLVECLGPVVTQRDLGYMARGTRENVNKTLRSWEKEGWIKLEDRHLLVLDRDALEDFARGG